LFGIYNAWWLLRIDAFKIDAEGDNESRSIISVLTPQQLRQMNDIAMLIQDGSDTFLKTEFKAIFVFIFFFSIFLAVVVEREPWTFWVTGAFLLGSLTSLAAGYIGMWISVRANVRTTKKAHEGLDRAFVTAYRGGAVLGFTLVGLGLLNLVLLIMFYRSHFIDLRAGVTGRGYKEMFEAVAGYGLGGSAIALFARVGGGIYTKAADVGADLVGKVV